MFKKELLMEYKKLLNQLSTQLNQIEKQNNKITKQANLSVIYCRDILSKMHQIVLTNSFENEESEIKFFKKTKIIPLSKLVFYSEVLTFEIQFPKATKEEQIKYIEKRIKKIIKFYDYNIDFIQYVREDKTHFDTLYYTRVNCDSYNFTNTKLYYRTPEFSTSHDILLGKLKGYDLLIIYLQNKLYNLQNLKPQNTTELSIKSNLHWTSSKVDLNELIYAVHSSGVINNGAAGIKEIATVFEQIFNIDLGNYYHRSIEIRSRKINKTIFMDRLKESLIKDMDRFDE